MFLTREKIEPQIASLPTVARNDGRGVIARRAEADEAISGASILFFGMVRNHSDGRKVQYLEYEAYEEMAERMIEETIQKAYLRWPVTGVRILHRLGRIELGEMAVAIQVCAGHRDEAYRASRFLIESIKHKVPIWKKEIFEDGTSEWSLCNHPPVKQEMGC